MTDRPILFSTSMVKAIIGGNKTMTRRIIKPQPEGRLKCVIQHECRGGSCWMIPGADQLAKDFKFHKSYEVGDRLWVRETYCNINKPGLVPEYFYKADIDSSVEDYDPSEWKWKPSIFMPKEAARIWLEVADVRVEKLQEITEEDAEAEGVAPVTTPDIPGKGRTYKQSFGLLWNEINAKRGYSWETNPWVWVISFKRMEVTA